MEDKWLKQIHNMVDGFESDAPEGLWNDIQTRMDDTRRKSASRHIPIHRPLYRRTAVAAAALAAVIITATWLWLNNNGDAPAAPEKACIAANGTQSRPDRHVSGDEKPSNTYVAEAVLHANIPKETASTAPANPAVSQTATADTAASDQTSAAEEQRKYIRAVPTPRHGTPQHTTYSPAGTDHGDAGTVITLGAFASGGMDGEQCLRCDGPPATASCTALASANTYVNDDSPSNPIGRSNAVKEIDHRQPVRFGLTVAFRLTDRLSLETGLTYAYLSSDIRKGKVDNYYTGDQTLHYVGIPITAKYTVASWKFIKAYASAGFLAEKCVAGKTEKEYVIGDNTMFSETEKTVVNPLQWSVNAAVGVQLDITPAVGVYAEPGLSYYFNNGSPVRTIYKDKPLNFNLNVGVRLTVF